MANNARFAEIAMLAGEPARAAMLHVLMDGRAFTATELARVANITPQTASGHLAKLCAADLVRVSQQGRHRYHRLASAEVAHMMESIMQVAANLAKLRAAPITGPRDAAMRAARTCYDHFAGRLGVALADALVAREHVELTQDAGVVTESGAAVRRYDVVIGYAAEALPAGSWINEQRLVMPAPPGLDGYASRLLDALGLNPQSVDELGRTTGFPATQVMAALSRLEVEGLVESLGESGDEPALAVALKDGDALAAEKLHERARDGRP